MPSKSSLYYRCRCDLFILPKNFSFSFFSACSFRSRGNAQDAIHLEPQLYWISPLVDQACKEDISPCTKIKIITMIKQTWGLACSSVERSRFYKAYNGVKMDTKSLHRAIYKVEVWKSNYTTSWALSGRVWNYECTSVPQGLRVQSQGQTKRKRKHPSSCETFLWHCSKNTALKSLQIKNWKHLILYLIFFSFYSLCLSVRTFECQT